MINLVGANVVFINSGKKGVVKKVYGGVLSIFRDAQDVVKLGNTEIDIWVSSIKSVAFGLEILPVLLQRKIEAICMKEGRNLESLNLRINPPLECLKGDSFAIYEGDESICWTWFVEHNEID